MSLRRDSLSEFEKMTQTIEIELMLLYASYFPELVAVLAIKNIKRERTNVLN